MQKSTTSTPVSTVAWRPKREIENPFSPEDFARLTGAEITLNPGREDPNLEEVFLNILQCQKSDDQRQPGMVQIHTMSGFGAEIALTKIVPACRINNLNVKDVMQTHYAEIQRDIAYRDTFIAVKVSDESQFKNRKGWWISKHQQKSLERCKPFCDYLTVFGSTPVDMAGSFLYRAKYLIDLKRFMYDFRRWTDSPSEGSYSYRFNYEKAIDAKLCIDLQVK